MRSVLISIRPKWCELITSGKKTMEVRKTRPTLETPLKVYIYCTADTVKHIVFDEYGDRQIELVPQRVIGEFVCDEIKRVHFVSLEKEIICALDGGNLDAELCKRSCVSYKDAYRYLRTAKKAYAWHISNLKIYDKPKELSEFYVLCDRCDKKAIRCEYGYEENTENGYYSECMCDFKRPIKRPPQSWC